MVTGENAGLAAGLPFILGRLVCGGSLGTRPEEAGRARNVEAFVRGLQTFVELVGGEP